MVWERRGHASQWDNYGVTWQMWRAPNRLCVAQPMCCRHDKMRGLATSRLYLWRGLHIGLHGFTLWTSYYTNYSILAYPTVGVLSSSHLRLHSNVYGNIWWSLRQTDWNQVELLPHWLETPAIIATIKLSTVPVCMVKIPGQTIDRHSI